MKPWVLHRIREAKVEGAAHLDLSCKYLREIPDELFELSNVTSLNLKSNSIGDEGARTLSKLTNLTSLNLDSNKIGAKGARALSTLTNLTSLKLGVNGIGDEGARALSTLTNLTSLKLDVNGIGDEGARALSTLTKLTDLKLDWNRLGAKGAQALSTLTKLASLNLCHSDIGDDGARALSTLTNLISLKLDSNDIGADGARALSTLRNLTVLELRDNARLTTFEPLLPLLNQLRSLHLEGCEIEDPPREVWEHSTYDLSPLRAHYRDRALGEGRDAEFKVCILGNGHIGKTQMCRRLVGEPFDESVPTTHGIQLGHLELTIDGLPFRLNLWDFGGQEIYHGSHALFLQGQAIFVVLWNSAFEQREYPDGGTTIQNRPLSYWLDFIRGLAGTDAPVLLVQSQCDHPNQRQAPTVTLDDFRLPRPLSFSAKTDFGLTVLRGELEDAVRDIVDRKPVVMIGSGRIAIRNQLREMLEEDQKLEPPERKHRTLSMEEFERLCAANGKISSPAELLRYLDRSGVVFHRPGVFNDQIILDQDWALKAIYTLFDRQRAFRSLRDYGRFTRSDLALVAWQEFSTAEQELFLSMMQNCGICFPVCKICINDREQEWEYIAPELLPEESGIQHLLQDRMQGDRQSAGFEIRYRFLHEGILRGLLSKLGTKAGNSAVYWKYGCWFHEQETDCQILVQCEMSPDSGRGTVTLRALGERPRELLEIVLMELLNIPIGHPPEVAASKELLFRRGERAIGDEARSTSARIESPSFDVLRVSQHPNLPTARKPAIYISYAWGDDMTKAGCERENVMKKLCVMVDATGYEVIKDDQAMRHGDWISDFMKVIGRGDHVLVILSKKYLRSPYCMTELNYIYMRSMGDKDDFLQRVVPVVVGKSLDFGDWRFVNECVDHWKREMQEMEPVVLDLGRAQIDRYRHIKQWCSAIGDIMGFIADKLHPVGFDAIMKDDFAAVRQMLPPA